MISITLFDILNCAAGVNGEDISLDDNTII